MGDFPFEKDPHPVDIQVGARLRERRRELDMSQVDLGKKMGGISFQQVQKYESGVNRLSASRLYEAAIALKVPTAYFFNEVQGSGDEAIAHSDFAQLMGEPGQPELSRLYASLPSRKQKRALLTLVRAMTSED